MHWLNTPLPEGKWQMEECSAVETPYPEKPLCEERDMQMSSEKQGEKRLCSKGGGILEGPQQRVEQQHGRKAPLPPAPPPNKTPVAGHWITSNERTMRSHLDAQEEPEAAHLPTLPLILQSGERL